MIPDYAQDDLTEFLKGVPLFGIEPEDELWTLMQSEWQAVEFWKLWEPCPNCDGSGHTYNGFAILTCSYCNGDTVILRQKM